MRTQLPLSYRWVRANGLYKLVPWHFVDDDTGRGADAAFIRESPEPITIRTFARRQDCDDFAGFVVGGDVITDEVIYFHPSFGAQKNPYMINARYPDFYAFLIAVVIPDTQDWMSEGDLPDIHP